MGWRTRTAVILLGTPLLLRLMMWLELRGDPFFNLLLVDARTNDEIARQIAGGGWQRETAFWQPPLYPYFVAFWYKLFGARPDAVRLAQILLGSLSALLVFRLADRLFWRRAAWLAWTGVTLSAPLLFMDLQLLNAGPAIFLLLCGLDRLAAAGALNGRAAGFAEASPPGASSRRPRGPGRAVLASPTRDLALAGLAFGLAAITVASLLSLVLAVALWLVWQAANGPAAGPAGPNRTDTQPVLSTGAAAGTAGSTRSAAGAASRSATPGFSARGRGFAAAGIFTLAAMVPVLLVTMTNYTAGRELVLISSNGGINFWIGNNPDYDRTVTIRPGRAWNELVRRPLEAGARSPAAASRWFYQQSLEWMRRDPVAWLGLTGKKILLFLRGEEIGRNQEIYPFRERSVLLRILLWPGPPALPFGLLLPVAVAGAIRVVRRRPRGAVLLAILSGLLATSVIAFFVAGRYRLPLVPLLCIFAGAGIDRWIRDARAGARRPLVIAGGVALALAIVAHAGGSRAARDFHPDTYSDMGRWLHESGDTEGAARVFLRALDLDPGSMEAANNLGAVRLKQGKLEEAERLLRRVLDRYPGDPTALDNLGSVYMKRGEPYLAGDFYTRAARGRPQDPAIAAKVRAAEDMAEVLERQRLDGDPRPFLDLMENFAADKPENGFLVRRVIRLFDARGEDRRLRRVVEARLRWLEGPGRGEAEAAELERTRRMLEEPPVADPPGRGAD